MEQLILFLTSKAGQYLCWAFLFVGIIDIIISMVYFGGMIKKLEQSILPGMSPQENQVIMDRIKKVQFVIRFIAFNGFAFIAFAAFGLTR